MELGVTPLSWAQWLARALDLPYTSYAVNGAVVADVLHAQLPRARADYDVGGAVRGRQRRALAGASTSPPTSATWTPVAAGLAARADRLLMLTMPEDLGRPPCGAQAGGWRTRSCGASPRATARSSATWRTSPAGRSCCPTPSHPTPLGQLEIADRAARALGAGVLPSALVADRRGARRALRPGPRAGARARPHAAGARARAAAHRA